MRILITSGLGKTDIGGPFQYAHNLEREFKALGHEVRVDSYGSIERRLPIGLRHLFFLIKILPGVRWSDKILTLDTYSVGVPTVLAGRFFGKKVVIRVGGDFLYSAYLNRTDEKITLSAFYENLPELNIKEKLIFFFTKFTVERTDFLAFNTEWQRKIWALVYGLNEKNSGVARNFIPERAEGTTPQIKNILWAGRVIPEKNLEFLKRVGKKVSMTHPEFKLDIITGESHKNVLERLRGCYAATSVALTDISPNFIIEAISFGKPFILTKETGLNELFPKGGSFINPLNEDELEKAIEAMLDERTYNGYVEELKENKLTHSWEELAKDFLIIWERL